MLANLVPLGTITINTGAGALAGSSIVATSAPPGVRAWRFEAPPGNTGNVALSTKNTVNAAGPVDAVTILAPGEDVYWPHNLADTWFSADAAGQKLMVAAVGP
jgi:hypothetical protein